MIRKYLDFNNGTPKRGLASIIGTLLLIAITVVGGSITAVYSGGLYNTEQVSGYPEIEHVEILGYDTRTYCTLTLHSGFETYCGAAADTTEFDVRYDERIAVYVANHSVKQVLLSEVRFGGTVYDYSQSATLTVWDDNVSFVPGQYAIADSYSATLLGETQEIQAGQTITIILDLDSDYKIGRDVQMRITTNNDSVFLGTVTVGDYKIG